MSAKAEYIVDLTEANLADVVGRSRQVPVLVDFWADWCAPCKQIGPVLEKLAHEYKGAFILAKVNADKEPLVTQQFGVRGLPTLKVVFQGQLAGELVGAHPEATIRKLLEPYLGAGQPGPAEEDAAPPDFHELVMAAAQDGRLEDAIDALYAQLAQAKDDHKSRVMLVELLVQADRLDDAQAVLAAGPEGEKSLKRAHALLGFARRTSGIPLLRELEALVQSGAADNETHYGYALRLVSVNRVEEGMDLLLEILRRDRQWGEDQARRTLLEVFDLLGRDDPLTARFRRRMANYLL